MAEGFRVARPIAARAGTSSSARGTLGGGSLQPLAARAGTATSARASTLTIASQRSLTARAGTAASARGTLIVFTALAPPGVFAMFRNRVALTLSALDPDWEVHAQPVDSVTAPAFMLEWADPWTVPATPCTETAALDVLVIAPRIDVEPGYDTLERMVEAALIAFGADGFPHGETSAPRPFEIGGLTYLAARIQVRNVLPIGG